MLLDGDLGLTERVPLELHVNTCGECRQKLADLQVAKIAEERPAPPPVHHWPPILVDGLVGKALGAMRTDDAASRVRRFLLERFPPRNLAAAAAVPLVVMLAIFVFERGFAVGTAMRQRPSSAPAAMRSGPPAPTSPTVASPDPVASPPRPPAPPSPSPTSPAPPPARTQSPLAQVAPPTRAVETKGPERKAIEEKATPRKPEPTPSSKAAPVKTTPAPSPSPAAESTRRESGAVAPPHGGSDPTADAIAAAHASRRGAVDVVGRLRVKSRSEAERNLTALLAHAGGTSVSRQRGGAVTVVEVAVPQASYGKFAQGLVRIGSWQLEAERSPLPDLVKVSVRLAD